jgi:hypothetical protein
MGSSVLWLLRILTVLVICGGLLFYRPSGFRWDVWLFRLIVLLLVVVLVGSFVWPV